MCHFFVLTTFWRHLCMICFWTEAATWNLIVKDIPSKHYLGFNISYLPSMDGCPIVKPNHPYFPHGTLLNLFNLAPMQNKVDFLVNLWACNYLPWRPRCLTYFILQIERLEQKIRRQEKDLAETSNQVSQRGEHISNTVFKNSAKISGFFDFRV